MYFPYLRGRQFELIAIRELIENNLLSEKVIPIIEPVRASSTLIKTLSLCVEKSQPVAFIINPRVGSFVQEFNTFDKQTELINLLKNETIIKACIVEKDITKQIDVRLFKFDTTIDKTLFFLDKKDYIDSYISSLKNIPAKFNLMPDERDFRRTIRDNRVIFNDSFESKDRNSDYGSDAEFFSSDHLYYNEDGYIGFGDYSVVGNKFSEAGFAPYCLVIHIVYFDSKDQLLIQHFSSDSNEDATDPANKFREAVEKLLAWNARIKLNTFAINQLKNFYDDGAYPGLGTIKKLSIMHHIEIVNDFLNR